MFKASLFAAGLCAGSIATTVNAATITWDGDTSSDITVDSNYDGLSVAGIESIGAIPTLTDDLVYVSGGANAPILGDADGFQDHFGTTGSITFDGVTVGFTAGSNDGWEGGSGISLINGASTTSFFFSGAGTAVTIDGTSSATLLGTGDAISNGATVNLLTGGSLTMANLDELNQQINESSLLVNGTIVTVGNRADLLNEDGSGGAIAVPEPGSLALLGLAGLCVLRRRRD